MRQALILIALLIFLTGSAGAATLEDKADLKGLQDAAENYLDGVSPDGSINVDEGIKSIVEQGGQALNGVIRKAVRSGIILLIIILMCAVAEGSFAGTESGGLPVVPIVGALAVTTVSVADMNTLVGLGREAIDNMTMFSKALLPTMAAVTAASGAPASASVRQLATVLFSDFLLTLIDQMLMPLVYIYIATLTAFAAIGNEGLKRVAGAVKWVVTTVLTTVLLAFVGYLTVSGVIAGTADAVTIKAAKFTMSSVVPVVGGILSDAAETVLAGAGILRSSVGVFGMLAVIAICVTPFLYLGIHYLTYKCAAVMAATISGGRVTGLIDGIGSAFGLVLGMTGACALLLLIAMISSVTLAVG